MPAVHSPPHRRRSTRRAVAAVLLAATLVAAAPASAAPHPHPDADASVITTWNQLAVTTITTAPPAGVGAGPAAFNYFAFVHLAMYNAVVAITGEYELYRWDAQAPKVASPEAAAAAAAHRILTTYFPANTTNLNNQLAASLANVRNPVARANGQAFGVLAADRIIFLRNNDGRHASVTVPPGGAAGVWSPTAALPAGAFGTAWLGGVNPIAVTSTSQFAPGPPPALTSAQYLADLAEVQAIGEVNSNRTTFQSQTARFFSDAGIVPMQAALRERATRRNLDIDDSARMFAAVDTAIADGAGTVWKAKLQYMLWRPVTAIRASGLTTWTSFIPNPPYPDWPSGLCSVVGATSTALTRLDGSVDLNISSAAAGETRYYGTSAPIQRDAVDARVWSGIHFRFADTKGIEVGTNVANYVLDHYFQPTD